MFPTLPPCIAISGVVDSVSAIEMKETGSIPVVEHSKKQSKASTLGVRQVYTCSSVAKGGVPCVSLFWGNTIL